MWIKIFTEKKRFFTDHPKPVKKIRNCYFVADFAGALNSSSRHYEEGGEEGAVRLTKQSFPDFQDRLPRQYVPRNDGCLFPRMMKHIILFSEVIIKIGRTTAGKLGLVTSYNNTFTTWMRSVTGGRAQKFKVKNYKL